MTDYTEQGIRVHLEDGVEDTPEVRGMVREYITRRKASPIAAVRGTRANILNFASPNMLPFCTPETPHFRVCLREGGGTLCLLDGLTERDITPEDLAFARKLWEEDVYVSAWQDGTPCIDD